MIITLKTKGEKKIDGCTRNAMKSKRNVGVEIDRSGHRRGSVDDGMFASEDDLPGSSSSDLHSSWNFGRNELK